LEHTQHLVDSLKSPSTPGRAPAPSHPVQYPLGRLIDADALIDAVSDTAANRWGGTWKRRSQPDEVLQKAPRYFSQFQSAEWTWTR
jgi:hypothetical protein